MEELWEHILIVMPKPPLCEWVNSVLEDQHQMTMEELYQEPLIIKLGQLGKRQNLATLLQDNYQQIMEHEFSTWTKDGSLWPQDRSLEGFNRYFIAKIDSPYRIDNMT
jgi:hypothetical protein